MSLVRSVFVTIALCAAMPAGAQVFEPWDGQDPVQEGHGGTKKVVDGIEVWAVGAPDCRYRILGYVHDTRHKLDLFGLGGDAAAEAAVAKVAKQAGGEAIYLVSSESQNVGGIGAGVGSGRGSYHESTTVSGNSAVTRGSGSGVGVSLGLGVGIRKLESRYLVLKCLPPEPAPPPPAAEGAPGPAPAAEAVPPADPAPAADAPK
jgi:hypothetical protein